MKVNTKIAKILRFLAHKSTRTTSRKICIQPGRYTSQTVLYAKRGPTQPQKDALRLPKRFRRKEIQPQRCVQGAPIVQRNPSYPLFRRPAQCVDSQTIETPRGTPFVDSSFPFSARGKNAGSRVTKDDDDDKTIRERRFYCVFRSQRNYVVTIRR